MATINYSTQREDQRRYQQEANRIIAERTAEILATFDAFASRRRATMATDNNGNYQLNQVGISSVSLTESSNLTSQSRAIR